MAKGRKTGGRKPGAKNRAKKALEQAVVLAQLQSFGEGYTSLTLLQAVYRDVDLPLGVRVTAAKEAAPYEHAKLSTVNVGAQAGSITFTFGRHDKPA